MTKVPKDIKQLDNKNVKSAGNLAKVLALIKFFVFSTGQSIVYILVFLYLSPFLQNEILQYILIIFIILNIIYNGFDCFNKLESIKNKVDGELNGRETKDREKV